LAAAPCEAAPRQQPSRDPQHGSPRAVQLACSPHPIHLTQPTSRGSPRTVHSHSPPRAVHSRLRNASLWVAWSSLGLKQLCPEAASVRSSPGLGQLWPGVRSRPFGWVGGQVFWSCLGLARRSCGSVAAYPFDPIAPVSYVRWCASRALLRRVAAR
jgi:hypothetical protein